MDSRRSVLDIKTLQQQTKNLKNLGDFITWTEQLFITQQLFFGHGMLDAWDEAVWLIFHVINLPLNADQQCLSQPITSTEIAACLPLILCRINDKKPIPYITHHAQFAGLDFYVDERVLIPRSPLAELIENNFQPWITPENITSILEIGTGSACIAIACAKMLPQAKVVAGDISVEALAVAKINVEKHGLQQQVQLLHSDLYHAVGEQRFDIIISNPPYLDKIDMTDLPSEYLHEPQSALAAGEDGLAFAIPILQQAINYLTPHGIVIVEVGNSEQALFDKFPNIPFYSLEFTRGEGYGVVLLTYEQLVNYQYELQAVL